jgi:uncharacterized membrane protein YgcG
VPGVSFVTAASYTLVFGLFVQTLVLTIYLLARAPDVLKKILGLWKPSMLAGFMGAFASQFWFLAFALTAAANVRTLALVEVLFAQAWRIIRSSSRCRRANCRHRADRGRRGAAGGGVTPARDRQRAKRSNPWRVSKLSRRPPWIMLRRAVIGASLAMTRDRTLPRQFRSSGSTGSGDTSTPSSISARASSGEASP